MSAAPRVLLLGGCGFIARNVVKYLVEFQLASKIRVVDKCLVSMAFLTDAFKEHYKQVEFVQANLTNPDHIQRAFNDPSGEYDIVINLAAETKYNQPDDIYALHILQLRQMCATEAARRGATRYIEVSTCQVYDSDKPVDEDGKLKPWTTIAKYHLEAERAIQAIPGLNYIIARLPLVYGPGDRSGLMSRVMCAAVYQHEKTKMEFLWGDDLRMNTLHAQDAAAGIWYLVCAGAVGEIYNIVDDSDTTQKSFNKVLEELFDVQTGCKGAVISTMATAVMSKVMKDVTKIDSHAAASRHRKSTCFASGTNIFSRFSSNKICNAEGCDV